MPSKQPVISKRLVVFARGVHHHFHYTLNVMGRLYITNDMYPHSSCYRRTHLVRIQYNALNLR